MLAEVRLKKGAVLLYAYPKLGNASTITEHANSFLKYSRFNVVGINVIRGLPTGLKLERFKLVILHYSLFNAIPLVRLTQSLDCSDQVTIGFFQDENQNCAIRNEYIDALEIDAIYTCLTPKDFEIVYGARKSVKRISTSLTGYVDDSLIQIGKEYYINRKDRLIDIGYRARELPYFMGKGAQEKTTIGHDIALLLKGSGLVLDIETNESNRLYGSDWDAFIANCKSMIGVEAGTSTFDLDGSIKKECEEFISKNPDSNFEEIQNAVLFKYEDQIFYRTISPRVFECAAFRVLMIMYEGHYSGVLKPNVHYVSLKKDYSNFDEALATAKDPTRSSQIIENAYRDLIESKSYSYIKFISSFDDEIELHFFNGAFKQYTLSSREVFLYNLQIKTWQKVLEFIENALSYLVVKDAENNSVIVKLIKSDGLLKVILKRVLFWEWIKKKILRGQV